MALFYESSVLERVVLHIRSSSAKKQKELAMGAMRIYVMASKIQRKPFSLATQVYPQNDRLTSNLSYTMMYLGMHRDHSELHSKIIIFGMYISIS